MSGYEIEPPACDTLTALVLDGAFVALPPLPNLRVLDMSKEEVDIVVPIRLPHAEHLAVAPVLEDPRCPPRSPEIPR